MNTKNDNRTLCEIPDSELEDLLYDYAVTQHGHASVKSYCNDLSLWGNTVDYALSLYTNTTHTPGPWEMGFDPYGYRITAKASTANMARREVCKVAAYIDPNSDDKANARLIAAAPELLEAVEALFEEFYGSGQWIVCQGNNPDRADAVLQQARAAIAKAEGSAE